MNIHNASDRTIRSAARPGVEVVRGRLTATVVEWTGARYVKVAYGDDTTSTWKLGEFEIA